MTLKGTKVKKTLKVAHALSHLTKYGHRRKLEFDSKTPKDIWCY